MSSEAFVSMHDFGELLNSIDKDLFLSLDLINKIFYLDEKLVPSHNRHENGGMKKIYEIQYSYHYDLSERKKILELVIQKFPDGADIYQKIFENMIDAHVKKAWNVKNLIPCFWLSIMLIV